MDSPDIFFRLGADVAQRGAAWLATLGLPGVVLRMAAPGLMVLQLILLLSAVAAAMATMRRAVAHAPARGPGRWAVEAAFAALAVVAYRLGRRLLVHPSAELVSLLVRWDHLVFALLAGTLLARLPTRWRTWTLAMLSAVVVSRYAPLAVVLAVLGAALLGYGASRWEPTRRPGVRVLVHGGLVVGVIGVLLWLRRDHEAFAGQGWNLWQFLLFRHVSFVIETAHGVPGGLGRYLCYALFYPNCYGAMEVYREFHDRNLRDGSDGPDLLRGVRGASVGATLMAVALLLPAPDALQAATSAAAWLDVLATFLRSAVFVTGLWASIEAGARFYGIQLRPNFSGVLTAQSPSRFWRAWRGTMTNWLIQHVYIPLGGNRRHRTLNIAAVFVVSTAWHCLGIPFMHPFRSTPSWYAPIVLWGAFNFAGVALHAVWVRRRPARTYAQPMQTLVLAGKIAATLCFGSFTVTLLNFALGNTERFVPLMCTLAGFPGRCG